MIKKNKKNKKTSVSYRVNVWILNLLLLQLGVMIVNTVRHWNTTPNGAESPEIILVPPPGMMPRKRPNPLYPPMNPHSELYDKECNELYQKVVKSN